MPPIWKSATGAASVARVDPDPRSGRRAIVLDAHRIGFATLLIADDMKGNPSAAMSDFLKVIVLRHGRFFQDSADVCHFARSSAYLCTGFCTFSPPRPETNFAHAAGAARTQALRQAAFIVRRSERGRRDAKAVYSLNGWTTDIRSNSDSGGKADIARGQIRAITGSGPPHSITSSARTRSIAGTSMPRALAVLRLITSSNLVGCSTGNSAGLEPLRMRSTYAAVRRKLSLWSFP